MPTDNLTPVPGGGFVNTPSQTGPNTYFGNATTAYQNGQTVSTGATNQSTPANAAPQFQPVGPAPTSSAPTGTDDSGEFGKPGDSGEFGKPGAGEQAFSDVGGQLLNPSALSGFLNSPIASSIFGGPGEGEQYAYGVMGSLLSPSNSQQVFTGAQPALSQPTASSQVFGQIQSMMPQIAATPGLDPYYANAKERESEDVNRQLAARGIFNSAPGIQQVTRGLTDLNAQQASQEAQYNLQRLAEERGWTGLEQTAANAADTQKLAGIGLSGQLGNLADTQKLGALGLGGTLANSAETGAQNRGTALGNLLTASGTLDLNKLNSYLQGGLGAQGAEATRGQNMINNTMGTSSALSGIIGQNNQSAIDADQNDLNAYLSMLLGGTTDLANFNQNQSTQLLSQLGSLFNGGKTLGLIGSPSTGASAGGAG